MSHLWDAPAGLLLGRARWYKSAMSFFGTRGGEDIAKLVFNGDAGTAGVSLPQRLGITQSLFNTTVQSYLYVALFTDHPGDGQATNVEATSANYGNYARARVVRNMATTGASSVNNAWTVDLFNPNPPNLSTSRIVRVTNAQAINFPPCQSSSGAIIKYWGVYDSFSGSNNLITYGPLSTSTASWKIGMYTDTATGTITSRGHGLSNGDTVYVNRVYNAAAGNMPDTGSTFDEGTAYYVISAATNTFQLSATLGGPARIPTNVGPFLFIRNLTLTINVGSIPSFTANSLVAAQIA